jgi:ribonuclease P protein subunit POP4
MTKITPKNLARHELIGLVCRVVHANNPSLEGIEGIVVDETRNMLVIEDEKEKKVPKKGTVFQFMLEEPVTIEGKALVGRPEDRVKMHGHRYRR